MNCVGQSKVNYFFTLFNKLGFTGLVTLLLNKYFYVNGDQSDYDDKCLIRYI